MNELMAVRAHGTIKFHEVLTSTFIISGTISIKAIYFDLLLGCPTVQFGPQSRGQPHSPVLITASKLLNEVGPQSPAKPGIYFVV